MICARGRKVQAADHLVESLELIADAAIRLPARLSGAGLLGSLIAGLAALGLSFLGEVQGLVAVEVHQHSRAGGAVVPAIRSHQGLRRRRDFARQRWPFGQFHLTRAGGFVGSVGCPATSSACGIRIC